SPPKLHQACPPRCRVDAWSTRATLLPAATSSAVATRPASPAPTTTTSASMRPPRRSGGPDGRAAPRYPSPHDYADPAMSTRERITRGMAAGLWRALVVMLLTLVAVVGGVATTQLWPVHMETGYFTADVSVEPRLDSTIQVPT